MKQLLFVFLILIATTACKKKTTVSIQARDYITGSGAAYAGQKYVVNETWSPVQEVKVKTVSEGFLDQNGFASFDLKMKGNRKYILAVDQPDNICYGGVTQYYLEHQKSNVVNFEYAKCGYVDIKSNNINCEGVNDQFRYKYYVSSNPDIYIYKGFLYNDIWDPQDYIEGCQDYSNIIIYNQRPVGNYTVEWQVVRPSGTTTGIDYFTVSENDTTTYVIQY